jgi:hypothetical protein
MIVHGSGLVRCEIISAPDDRSVAGIVSGDNRSGGTQSNTPDPSLQSLSNKA